MGTKALTQAAIEKMKPPAARREIPDGVVAGLYLVAQPSGAKSWAVRQRIDGRPVKITIGAFPTIGLKQARELGRDAILAAKQGRHLTEERREARQTAQHKAKTAAENTLQAICEEYLRREGKRLRTAAWREKVLTRLVYPALGDRQIGEIRRSEIVRLLDKIEDENGPVMADRTLATVRRVLNWHASRSDDFRSPIVRAMARTKPKERARERVLSDVELKAVWEAAEAAKGPFGALIRLVLTTAARRSEAAGMRWGEIENGDWILPASRNKTKVDLVRPLSGAAQAVLASLPRIGNSDYVFTTDGKSPISGFSKFKSAFDKASGVSGWTLHDCRRTSRSLMARAGVPERHAEQCLGHVIAGVEGTYNRHTYAHEMRLAYEKLASEIERVIHPSDNVTPLRRRR